VIGAADASESPVVTIPRSDRLALLCIPALACGRFLASSLRSPFANGWDSYFFLAQIDALRRLGHLHTPDVSLIYALAYPLSAIVGDDVLAFKIVLALAAAALAAGVALLSRRLGAGRLVALSAGLWTALSPTMLFVGFQFPRESLGLALFVWVLIGLIDERPSLWVPALAATVITHRLFAVLGLAAAIFVLIRRYRRTTANWVALSSVLIILGIIAASMVPGILRPADAARLSGLLTPHAALPPAAVVSWLGPISVGSAWSLELYAAYAVIVISAVVLSARAINNSMVRPGLFIAIGLLVMAFPFFVVNAESAGYRLILAVSCLAPLAGALAIGRPRSGERWIVAGVAAAACGVATAATPMQRFDPPYARYAALSDAITRAWERPPALLIAHKGLAELTTFRTGVPAMSWEPEATLDSTAVWRIVTDIDAWEITDALGDGVRPQPIRLPGTHALVREDVWRAFRRVASDDPNGLKTRAWSPVNPSRVRPAFLAHHK
jgi:hypothetical protein